jgi:hypothetical protein
MQFELEAESAAAEPRSNEEKEGGYAKELH